MGNKLKSVLNHFTRQGSLAEKKTLYFCNYCKWKTVVNVTRMQDHLKNKCLSCPNYIKKSSNMINTQDNISFDEFEMQCTSQEVQAQKTVSRQSNMMNFVDSVTSDYQVSEKPIFNYFKLYEYYFI